MHNIEEFMNILSINLSLSRFQKNVKQQKLKKVNDNNDKNKCIKSCVAATGCCWGFFVASIFDHYSFSSTECV